MLFENITFKVKTAVAIFWGNFGVLFILTNGYTVHDTVSLKKKRTRIKMEVKVDLINTELKLDDFTFHCIYFIAFSMVFAVNYLNCFS